MDSKEHQKQLDKLLVYNVKFNKVTEAADFISLGANVDTKDENGVPVLALAAEKGMIKMTEVLIKEGANLLEKDESGVSVYDRLMKKVALLSVKPNQNDALVYMTAIYLKNVLEGQNRYNGKRKSVLQNGFVESVIQSREHHFMLARVGDREHS